MLIRLIYASTAQTGVDLTEFRKILQQAQTNNQRRDLTGVLAFNSTLFLQGLEGARDQVNELYNKLLHDTRHHSVTMLGYREIEERQWSNWSMGFAAPNSDARALFLKYSSQSTFNPYIMKGDAAEKLLVELASKTISMAPPVIQPSRPVPSSVGSAFMPNPVRPVPAAATSSMTPSPAFSGMASRPPVSASAALTSVRASPDASSSTGTPLMSGTADSVFGPMGTK
jgi:Sensors of blue-light using FAD